MRSKQNIWNWYTFLLFWTKYENPYVSELNKRATDSKTNDSSIIIDLSLLTKSHAINKNTTFLEFADSLRKIILNKSSSCLRCDITADQYFKNSLKQKSDQVGDYVLGNILMMKQRFPETLEVIYWQIVITKWSTCIFSGKICRNINVSKALSYNI